MSEEWLQWNDVYYKYNGMMFTTNIMEWCLLQWPTYGPFMIAAKIKQVGYTYIHAVLHVYKSAQMINYKMPLYLYLSSIVLRTTLLSCLDNHTIWYYVMLFQKFGEMPKFPSYTVQYLVMISIKCISHQAFTFHRP